MSYALHGRPALKTDKPNNEKMMTRVEKQRSKPERYRFAGSADRYIATRSKSPSRPIQREFVIHS